MAVAGRDEPRERCAAGKTNGANADGKAVWSWHPLLVLSQRRYCEPDRARQDLNPLTTVTRRIRSPGRARNKPLKPLRGECRAIPGVTVVTMLVCFLSFYTRGCGRIERPAFPAPSDLGERDIVGKNSDASRREIVESHVNLRPRHCERSEAIHSKGTIFPYF
jgi:hypothetical protein